MRRQVGADTRPGIVVSVATSGDLFQWQPQGHILVADGAFSDDGACHPLATWDTVIIVQAARTLAEQAKQAPAQQARWLS